MRGNGLKLYQERLRLDIGKFLSCKSSQASKQAAQGGGGAAISGDVPEACEHGTLGGGLMAMLVLDWWLNFESSFPPNTVL